MNNSPKPMPAATTALDATAVALSVLCLLHCLALPLLVALLPLASASLLSDERFHRWMLWLVLPTTVLALGSGWRHHRRDAMVILGTGGLSLIAFAAYGEWLVGLDRTSSTFVTVIGALALSLSHVWNLRVQGRLHWHGPGERHDHAH